MNIPAILETARRIRENDLPFDFNMGESSNCIMSACTKNSLCLDIWADRKSFRRVGTEALGLDENQAYQLFYPCPERTKRLYQIESWRAADTLERLARTGRVEWDWSEPKMALIVVTPAQKHGG